MVGADTVVVSGRRCEVDGPHVHGVCIWEQVSSGKILGKPGTCAKAREMLTMYVYMYMCHVTSHVHMSRLNGHTHQVYTGVAMVRRKERGEFKIECFHEVTDVTFASLSDEVLESYAQSEEPL